MNVLITAGGTEEAIDNVRKITNSSTGALGKLIASNFANYLGQAGKVFYVCHKKSLQPKAIDGIFESTKAGLEVSIQLGLLV